MSDTVFNSVFANADGFPSTPFAREEIGPISTVYESISGTDQAFLHTTRDRMMYTINLTLYTRTERDAILEFYRTHQAQYEDFLFKDPEGYDVSRVQIGTGDGAEDEFQIYDVAGTVYYPRKDIVAASLSVWVATVLKTEGVHYNVDYTSSGIITFTGGNIPGAVAVEAEYEYYRRVRFGANYKDVNNRYIYPDIQGLQLIEKIVA